MTTKRIFTFFIVFLSISPVWTFSTFNDELERKIKMSQGKIFNGMYANYTFETQTTSYYRYNSIFKYTHESGDIFNVTWYGVGSSINTWLENIETRLISNSKRGSCCLRVKILGRYPKRF